MKEFFSNDIVLYLEEKTKSKCDFVSLFNDIETKFKKNELCYLFNFILKNKHEIALLNETIRRINKFKFIDNLNSLIDFILIQNTNNDFLNLKVLAIKTISGYKNKIAVQPLLFCLNDKNSNYKIKLASAEALGKIGDKNAFESLKNVVNNEEEKSTYVKESAITALGMLKDSRALDVFDSIINTKQMFLDKFLYLKEKIIEAISNFDTTKDKKAIEILKKALNDTSAKIRIAAIETIMNSDNQESYELIYDCLKYDSDIEVKKNALTALYNISNRKILDEVINNDFENELKNYAKKLLNIYEDNNEQ